MSMAEVIREMSGRSFEEFMNAPTWNGEAEIKECKDGKWVPVLFATRN